MIDEFLVTYWGPKGSVSDGFCRLERARAFKITSAGVKNLMKRFADDLEIYHCGDGLPYHQGEHALEHMVLGKLQEIAAMPVEAYPPMAPVAVPVVEEAAPPVVVEPVVPAPVEPAPVAEPTSAPVESAPSPAAVVEPAPIAFDYLATVIEAAPRLSRETAKQVAELFEIGEPGLDDLTAFKGVGKQIAEKILATVATKKAS